MTRNSVGVAVRAVLDVLIPGDETWPPATAAMPDVDAWLLSLPQPAADWLRAGAMAVFAAGPDARVARVAAMEAAAPALFGQVLAAAYDAYYNSPAAHAAVVRLAEAGPREPSAEFDPSLVAAVVAKGAGRRRL